MVIIIIMKLLSSQSMLASNSGSSSLLLAISFVQQFAQISLVMASVDNSQAQSIQSKLVDKCCQIGKERAISSQKFNCKLSAREALTGFKDKTGTVGVGGIATAQTSRASSLALAESFLTRDSNFADQCEMVLESCCLAHHRNRNCDSGKQLAKSGASCMDVELSKEVTVATESFNDCCMSCSLGILAAKSPSANETGSTGSRLLFQSSVAQRCKLISPLALSLSGQLYEQTYIECCQENLPRLSSALVEPGSPIDCAQSNPCSQRCVSAGPSFELDHFRDSKHLFSAAKDRCDCFSGYKLASDGINCVDIDECKLNQHSCNKQSEVCDNTQGSFRCLARQNNLQPAIGRSFLTPFSDEDSGGEYVSLRLCPLGSRWNSEEKRCISIGSSNGRTNIENHQNQARSASLFSSPLHLLPGGSDHDRVYSRSN